MPYILAGTASKNNSTNRPLIVDPPATSSKNSSRKVYRWRNFTRKKGSKSSLESISSDSTATTTTSTTTTTTSSSSSNTSYYSEGVNGGEVCPSPIIQGDDDGKAGHLEATHAPLNGSSSSNCTTAAAAGSIPQFTNTVVALLQGNSDDPLANSDASPSSVAASQSPRPTSHYQPSNNHPCYVEEEEGPVTEEDYSTSTVQSLFQLLLSPSSIHDSHSSSLSTANSDQGIPGNNSALSTTTGRPTSIAASETSTLRPRTTSSYDRPTSRPLSSYFRDPLPGDSPPLPSLSVSASPLESEDMTSLASNGRPSSTTMSSNSNGNNSGRDARQSYHQQSDDANVSAQIMNVANMIVSPVPQHRIHVSSGEDHLVSPRSSSLLNGQGQLPGQLQPGHYSYPSRQQDQHQQWQSTPLAAFPSTSMNNDTGTSSRNQPPPPPPPTKSRHRAQEEYEDYGDLTLEEMQELALSKANTRNSSMTNFSIYNNGVVDDEAPLPPVPSIPPAFNNSNTPQSSFSIITDNNASAYNGDHIASTSGSSSKARRRDPSSDNSMMNNHQDSSPKPKLRNLDTSVSAARGRVSSFFGGISDSLSGNSNNNTPNTTTASSATPSSTSYPSAMALREGSPLPSEGIHQPSSSYPSTSHMQPPPASSVPQSRSHSQPLQHQQTIPQYAIPPPMSQSQAQAQYAHHQQQASSSTSTHLHPASRSSFYGLDAHAQGQGGGGGDHEGQQQRWRSERRASPSTIASSSAGGSRPASQSVPRSDTGHYTSPSLGASSSSNYGGQGGGGSGAYYPGSQESGGNAAAGSNSRRRVTSWTTRSNASSVYGLNMASPHLAPSNSGDLLPLPSIPGGSNVPPVPHLTQAHLRPGQGVSLLSHQKTLDMYRANVKKTNDPEVTFELAQFMLGLAKEMAIQEMNANANAQQYFSNGGFALNGVSEENLLSNLNHGLNDTAAGDSSSPSPDPSFSFHSRSSGSSGDLQSAAIAANRTFSSQGLNHNQQGGLANMNAAGLQRRRGSHSPAGSISTAARLSAVGINRTGSPTSAHGSANAANGSNNNDRRALVAEALSLLKRSADRGHVASQYFLADIYANGGLETNKSGVSRASIYALLPGGGSHSHNNGTGSGNVSPLDMKLNPSPTGSSASLGQANSGFVSASSAPAVTSSHQKPDFDKALPLFIAAAKHGHIPSCYRAGECFENGWGCRKDATKAVQFYRKSAASSFPEAMYRLGMAELNGELGLKDRQKDGFKWLKQVAALAESNNENSSNNGGSVQMNGGNSQDGLNGFSSSPSGVLGLDDSSDINGSGNNNQGIRLCTVQALHELALLHERGIHNVVFVDNEYAAELLARASELGYAPSAYKLGECYEYGRMGCPQDAALSIHYYNIAAQQNHREACFALTAWYLVGSPGVLPQSDTEAYLWAKKAAEQGLAKAEYAVGYFTEVGIGTIKDEREAIQWFTKAAEHGDKRAITRLRTLGVNTEAIISPPMSPRSARMSVGPNSMTGHSSGGGGRKKGSRASNAHNPSASRDQTPNSAEMMGGVGAGGSSNGAPPTKEKRRSRRSTIPGIMGMSNKDVPPLPGTSGGGKKSDTDCIIS